ncbi:unnamed protein product [Discosporangium mesarthrocarpum]
MPMNAVESLPRTTASLPAGSIPSPGECCYCNSHDAVCVHHRRGAAVRTTCFLAARLLAYRVHPPTLPDQPLFNPPVFCLGFILQLRSPARIGQEQVARKHEQRASRGGPCMLSGQEFATCSDADFQAYIAGWLFVWSGIIPYTFIAARNILGNVVTGKFNAAVSEGEDATISNQALLFYPEPIKLLDVINIAGRFESFDDVQPKDKSNFGSTAYLNRRDFKESVKKSKFKGWPKGPDGQPAAGKAFSGDVNRLSATLAKREIPESTLDAFFDTFCGSPLSVIADRFKVDNQLAQWRKDGTFNITAFEGGLAFARLLFLGTIVAVLSLEAAGYGVFFIQPLIIRYGNPLAFLGF